MHFPVTVPILTLALSLFAPSALGAAIAPGHAVHPGANANGQANDASANAHSNTHNGNGKPSANAVYPGYEKADVDLDLTSLDRYGANGEGALGGLVPTSVSKMTNAERLAKGLGPLPPTRRSTGELSLSDLTSSGLS
jgi:hypothetical protein